MSRSKLFAGVVALAGISYVAMANTQQDAVVSSAKEAPSMTEFRALLKRVERLEGQMIGRDMREQPGRQYVTLDPVVTNLNDARLARYIRIVPVIVVEESQKEEVIAAFRQMNVEVNDWMNKTLSGLTPEELRGSEGQERLRQRLQQGINEQLKSSGYPEFVKSILFDQFAIQ